MPTVQNAIQKVRDFIDLSEGWHFGGGLPPSRENLSKAQGLLIKVEELEFDNADAFPGIDGEIQVAIYRGDDDYEFTIERNGTITFTHDENGKELRYEQGLSLDEAIETLVRVSDRIWPSLDFFTTNIMLRIADDLAVSPSRTQAMGQASQLLRANARNALAGHFVHMSPHSTLIWLESRSSIGKFRMKRFLTDVVSSKKTVRPATSATSTFKTGLITIPGELLSHY
jgi:hypothetical protein